MPDNHGQTFLLNRNFNLKSIVWLGMILKFYDAFTAHLKRFVFSFAWFMQTIREVIPEVKAFED